MRTKRTNGSTAYTYVCNGRSLASTIGLNNPLRYRDYVYDRETGLYYLQSRYYNPEMGRFINADSVANLGAEDELLGYNLFAYCGNNPVMGYDPTGEWSFTTFIGGVGLVALAVTDIAVAAPIVACASAGALITAIAVTTVAAASVTAVNGMAEIGESFTGYNAVRESLFDGNDEAYHAFRDTAAAVTEMGIAVCGAYTAVNGGAVCFATGTQVLTEAGTVNIEDIKAGDLVWAADPAAGETELKEVVQLFRNEIGEWVHLTINGEEITCTPEHPFYTPVKGWTEACDLRAGDILVTVDGDYVILEEIQHEILETPETTYNFEVADFHTYFVGNAEVLVHNTCRENAVKKACKAEAANVRAGGEGISRIWTAEEKIQLITNGKVDGDVGHHMKSVSGYPSLAGEASNIQFLTRAEHFIAHAFNWKTVTHGFSNYWE